MIPQIDCLERHYNELSKRFSTTSTGRYSTLVTANGNHQIPVHRWFRMKEAYSSALLSAVVEDSSLETEKDLSIFDPFSGSGTTGVSAGDMVRSGRLRSARIEALEVNPFLHLISRAKLSGYRFDRSDLQLLGGRVARRALGRMDGLAPSPRLTTFDDRRYISEHNLTALLALRNSIEHLDVDEAMRPAADVLRVALAAAVEPSTNLRRDGRALRFAANSSVDEPIELFLQSVAEMSSDVTDLGNDYTFTVRHADSRNPLDGSAAHNLAVFSPPYPNNIDYTEVYKMEGWLLGLYNSSEEFMLQRRRSLRSHSSLRWKTEYGYERAVYRAIVDNLLGPILSAIPEDRYARGRVEVVKGYADDMLATLLHTATRLGDGGKLAIIVGNSFHGKEANGYVIASDLILARLAEVAGFSVDRIEVARYPKRRKSASAFLRESVIFATRRHNDR